MYKMKIRYGVGGSGNTMMMLARPIIDDSNNAVLYVSTIRLFATVNIGIFAGPLP